MTAEIAMKSIDRQRPVLERIAEQIWQNPELGFEEVLRLPNDRGCGVDTVYYRHANAPSA